MLTSTCIQFGKGARTKGTLVPDNPTFVRVPWFIMILKKFNFMEYLFLVQLNLMAWIDKLLHSETSPRFWQFLPIKINCVTKWPIWQNLVSQLTTSCSYCMNYRHVQSPKEAFKGQWQQHIRRGEDLNLKEREINFH